MHRDAEAMAPLCGARNDAETRDYPASDFALTINTASKRVME
jgi:hypothetical protein